MEENGELCGSLRGPTPVELPCVEERGSGGGDPPWGSLLTTPSQALLAAIWLILGGAFPLPLPLPALALALAGAGLFAPPPAEAMERKGLCT